VIAGPGNSVTASSAIAGTKGVQAINSGVAEAINSGVDLKRNHEDVKDF
jgi:hypothetical protein